VSGTDAPWLAFTDKPVTAIAKMGMMVRCKLKPLRSLRGGALLYETNGGELADVFGRYYTLFKQRAHICLSMRIWRTLYCEGVYHLILDICLMPQCHMRYGGSYFRDSDVFLLHGIANGAWWDLFCGSLNRLILDINSHRVDTQYSLSEKFEVHR
jgi:hypothetical protein